MGGKNYGTLEDTRQAKYQGLSDNAARYGDIKGAMDIQDKLATIRGKGLSNQYDFKSMQTRLDQLEKTLVKQVLRSKTLTLEPTKLTSTQTSK